MVAPNAALAFPQRPWRGAWSALTAYTDLDVVSYAGSSYICILANTGQTPGVGVLYWNVVAVGATGTQGPAGPTGPQGVVGPNGTTWYSGAGVPAGGTGANGDLYHRTSNGDVYTKAAGVWGVTATILGPTGAAGPQGTQGIQGVQGVIGVTGPAGPDGKTVRSGAGAPGAGLGVDGDFYIDTTATTIYGPKTAGAWGSATSLVGPQGATGTQGIQGIQGPAGSGAATLTELTDVTITTPAAGHLVRHNGTEWVNVAALVDGDIPASISRDSELAAHEADTTAVHGVADTSVLETTTGAQTKVDTHAAAADPHTGYRLESAPIVDADVGAAAAVAETKLALASDAAAATASRRTLGPGALQAAPGNDARLSDARAPNGAAGGVLSGTYPAPAFAVDMATQAELDAYIAKRVFVRKTADQALTTSSTVFQDDTHINLALAANEIWEFKVVLRVDSTSATPDIKIAFTGPTGASIMYGGVGQALAATSGADGFISNGGLAVFAGSNWLTFAVLNTNPRIFIIEGLLVNGSTAGTLQLQEAQSTSDAATVTVYTNSYMLANRVA